jgi:GMP synthase-like glutamine amidotransferase
VSPPASSPTVLVVQHEESTGPGWFGEWLRDAGVVLDIVHPYRGADLPELTPYDGLLVLGGAMGPAEDERCPWLPATRALMADAVDRSLPTFGICLGGELLALACGGQVMRGRHGPELGVRPVSMRPEAADDPLFGAVAATASVVQWHWEEISALPESAVWLVAGDAYPHQAFRVGSAAWGVQGHPEVTGDIAAAWAREDSPLLLAAGRDPVSLVAEVRGAEPTLTGTWRQVAARFAGLVGERAMAGA